MNTKRMLRSLSLVTVLSLLLLGPATTSASANGADHVRWDIISVDFAAGTVSEGGIASALAEDGSMITLTGNGTFVAPAGGTGRSRAAKGGGTWETFDSVGMSTGSGTYEVTGLVLWEQAPGTPPLPIDLIGDIAEASAGLAVLTIEYSDGERGVLVVSCHLVGTPDSVFEGVNASKGFVHYYDNVTPVNGVDANRTLFHVSAKGGNNDEDDDD
jgi:hypothetical protein